MGKGTLLGQIFIVCWCLFLRGELCAARKKPLLVCAPEMSGCLGVWMNCGESRVTIYMCVDTCASRWFILWSSIYMDIITIYTGWSHLVNRSYCLILAGTNPLA